MKSRHLTRILRLTGVLMCLVLMLSACGGTATPAASSSAAASASSDAQEATPAASDAPASSEPSVSPTEAHNDMLRLPVTTTFLSTDPHYSAQNADYLLYVCLYESFYDVDGQQNMTPRLATGYDVSEDGLVYTYHLKPGVKWQTGGDFKASDVVYSIKRAQESPYTQSYVAAIADVKAPDDLTVVITLTGMSPTFFVDINRVMFLSEEATAGLEPGFSNQLSGGTGPYRVVEYAPDQKVVIDRNPDYHGDPAPIGTLSFTVFGDSTAVLRAFEAGEIDWLMVPAADWSRIESSGKYKTFIQDTISTFFFTMNNEVAPFNDVKVRQAFNYAVNKEDMMLASMEGIGRVASSLGNPSLVFGIPEEGEIFEYTYDPEKAKALLAEAGYADGLTLDAPIIAMGSDEFTIPCQVLQEQLAAVGVKAEIQTMEQSAYIADVMSGNYSIGVMALSMDIDASMFSMAYTSSGINALNLARYSNERVDELFTLAASTLDQNERKAYFTEAFDIASKDAAYLPLYCLQATLASDPDLSSTVYKSYYDWRWE